MKLIIPALAVAAFISLSACTSVDDQPKPTQTQKAGADMQKVAKPNQ